MADIDASQPARRAVQGQGYLVGIVGMGYVGLTLACTGAGPRVVGFDVDEPKVEALNRGESPLKHIGDARVAAARGRGAFEATPDFSRLGEPNLFYVEATTRSITAALRPRQLVVLESTTWPGTTREVVRPILEATSLRSGSDFFLAYRWRGSCSRRGGWRSPTTTRTCRRSRARAAGRAAVGGAGRGRGSGVRRGGGPHRPRGGGPGDGGAARVAALCRHEGA